MHVSKKDHENCNRAEKKKNMYFIMKTLLNKKKKKKKKKNALTGMNTEPSLYACGIVHCT